MELKRHFWRNGFQYSMLFRKNYLVAYAGSLKGRIAHYIILTIFIRQGIEHIFFSDDYIIDTYAEFTAIWERLINKQLKKQNHEN